MLKRSTGLMQLVLTAGLVVGVALFVGCGNGNNSSGGGGDSGSGSGTAGGGGSGAGGGGASSSTSIDHSSPEALFSSVLRAVEARDYHAIATAYPPSAHDEMAMGMVAMSAMTSISPSVDQDAVRGVLEKHGIDPENLPAVGANMEQEARALADGIENKAAFIGDMMGTLPDMHANAMRGLGMAEGAAIDSITLSDLQVDGDTASGRVNAGGLTDDGERRVNFVREDGKWYMGVDG